MRKKAQIRMMETMGVLIVFFIILIFAFMFVIKTNAFSFEKKVVRTQELEAIRVSQAISFLPELQCSARNIIVEDCFDIYKLQAFNSLPPQEKASYYNQFFFSNISVTYLSGNNKGTTIPIYLRHREGSQQRSVMPVALYDPVLKTYDFGLLEVIYYSP